MLFVSWKGVENPHRSFTLQRIKTTICQKPQPRAEFGAKAEYSDPLRVTIFQVQHTGLKTQYALNSLHKKLHSGLVMCRFVSRVKYCDVRKEQVSRRT